MSTIVFTDRAAGARHARAEQNLARAAAAARKAPVVGAQRPWRWQLTGDRAELYVAPDDPADVAGEACHVVDCGSALHHALTALAGEGALVDTDTFPDPAAPDLLASVRLTGFGAASPAEIRAYQAISLRPTTAALRGRAAVATSARAALEAAAGAHGARLCILDGPPDLPDARDALIVPDRDSRGGWLDAGQALSAVALTAAMERLVLSVGHGMTTAGPGGRPAIAVRLATPGIRPRRAAADTAA